jgi:hypothetical protein
MSRVRRKAQNGLWPQRDAKGAKKIAGLYFALLLRILRLFAANTELICLRQDVVNSDGKTSLLENITGEGNNE